MTDFDLDNRLFQILLEHQVLHFEVALFRVVYPQHPLKAPGDDFDCDEHTRGNHACTTQSCRQRFLRHVPILVTMEHGFDGRKFENHLACTASYMCEAGVKLDQ